MSVMDSNGRLFGRLNVIDAAVLAIVIAAIPAAVVAYRSMQSRSIEIARVDPPAVTAGEPARVFLDGTGFRPYLQAYFAPSGSSFVLTQSDRLSQRTKYLLSSAIRVELQVPELAPGAYDLYLYDQGQQVASRAGALMVTQPPAAAVREAKVRFYLPPETASLIKTGDRDQPGGAVITDVRQTGERGEVMEMHLVDQDSVWTGHRMTGELVDITLDVPQVQSGPDTWTYQDQPLLAGNIFLLTTDRYRLHGVVTWVGEPEPHAAAAR